MLFDKFKPDGEPIWERSVTLPLLPIAIVAGVVTVAFLALLAVVSSQSARAESLSTELSEVSWKLDESLHESEVLSEEASANEEELTDLKSQLESSEKSRTESETKVSALKSDIVKAEERAKKAEGEVTDLKKKLKAEKKRADEAERKLKSTEANSASTSTASRTFDKAPNKGRETEREWVAAWGDAIDAYLNGRGNVPLRGYGRKFAQAAWDHGCDPRLSVAISETESGNGVSCMLPYNAWGWLGQSFSSFDEGIDRHAAYLVESYGMPFGMDEYAVYCGGENTEDLWEWVWAAADSIIVT